MELSAVLPESPMAKLGRTMEKCVLLRYWSVYTLPEILKGILVLWPQQPISTVQKSSHVS